MTTRRLDVSTVARAAMAAAMLLGVAAPAAADVILRVSAEVSVRGEQLTVADLGPIEGDPVLGERLRQVGLGAAPVPGSSYRLDPSYLQLRLRQQQIDPARVRVLAPERVTIVRAFQVLPGQAVVDAAGREALERLSAVDPQGGPYALVPVNRPGETRVPLGRVELQARAQDSAPPYLMLPVSVAVRIDGQEFQTLPVTFRVARRVEVVVATRALEPKATLGETDFRVDARPSTEVPPGALGALPDLGDLEAVRVIRAGEIVTDRMLRARVAVRRGDAVTLLFDGRGFRITARGQVAEDGRRGDMVRVVNPVSKREVVGRVEAPGLIRVGP